MPGKLVCGSKPDSPKPVPDSRALVARRGTVRSHLDARTNSRHDGFGFCAFRSSIRAQILREPCGRAGPGKLGQALLRGAAVRGGFVRVFVAQFVEAEPAAPGDFQAAGDRVFMAAEQPRHLRRRFQMALGVGGEAKAGVVDRAAGADAGQHILQRPPLGNVIEHVVGRDQRQPRRLGQSRQIGEAARIVAAIEVMGGKRAAAGKIRRDPRGKAAKFVPDRRLGRQQDDGLALAMRCHIGVIEPAFALGGAALAESEQPGQPAIGGAILGKGEEARAVAEIEPAADHETDPDLLCRLVRAHDAGEAVPVGDRDGAMAEGRRAQHQLGRMRRPAQKREIGGDLQLGIAGPAIRRRGHG